MEKINFLIVDAAKHLKLRTVASVSMVFAMMFMLIVALITTMPQIARAQTQSQSPGNKEVSTAKNSPRRVIEKLPSFDKIYRVSASKTPSGYPVPRYVSLKVGKVNGRTGPSRSHSIAWQYHRRGLPLIVVAETDMWRKVRDMNGDESWIHKPALSGEPRVIVLQEASLHTKPRETANITALADKNALMELTECNADNWCQVKSDNGLKGWIRQDKLWGAQALY